MRLVPGPLEAGIDQQVRGLALNRLGDAQNVQEGNIPLAALNLAHMRAVDICVVGQSFLG